MTEKVRSKARALVSGTSPKGHGSEGSEGFEGFLLTPRDMGLTAVLGWNCMFNGSNPLD